MKIWPFHCSCRLCGYDNEKIDRLGVNLEMGKLVASVTCELCGNKQLFVFSIVEVLMREYHNVP